MSLIEDSEEPCPKRQKIADECGVKSDPHILDFPEEVLLKIISYLPTYDILLRVGLVCKRFYNLSKTPTLIEELSFNDNIDTSTLNSFSDVLKSSKNLKKLCIGGFVEGKENLISVGFKNCPKICQLEIKCDRYCNIPTDYSLSDECMRTIADFGKGLQILNLQNTNFSTDVGSALVAQLKNLRHVNLEGCNVFSTDDDLSALTDNCKNLVSLNIMHCTMIDGNNWIGLEEHYNAFLMKKKATLKSLCVQGGGNDSWGLQFSNDFYKHLSECQELEELLIFYEKEHLTSFQTDAISKLHKLKKLELHSLCDFAIDTIDTSDYTKKIYINMFSNRKLSNLRELKLIHCEEILKDVVLMNIAIECPDIEVLEIDQINRILPISCFHNLKKLKLNLFDSRSVKPNDLSYYDLCCIFKDKTLKHLLDVSLECKDVQLTKSVIKSIVDCCPKLELLELIFHENYDGELMENGERAFVNGK